MKDRKGTASPRDKGGRAAVDATESASVYRRFADKPDRVVYRMSQNPPPDDIARLILELDRLRWHVESVTEALREGQAKDPSAWLRPEFRQGSNRDIARQLVEAHKECAYVQWSKERLAEVAMRWRANLRFMFETARETFPVHGQRGNSRLVEALGTPIDPALTAKAERLMTQVAEHKHLSPWNAAVQLTQELITTRYAHIAADFAKQGADKLAREKPDGPDPEFKAVIWMICETLKDEAIKRRASHPPSAAAVEQARNTTPPRRRSRNK